MKNKNILYITAVTILIIAFNISVILNVKAQTPLSITIVILVSLLLLILFKNRALNLGNNKLGASLLAILGILLTLTNHKLAFGYAVCGVLVLTAIQFRIMSRSGAFILVGGKPTEKLNTTERAMAISGLAIIGSVLLTFIAQLFILKSSI